MSKKEITVLNTGGTIGSILEGSSRKTKENLVSKEINNICSKKEIKINNKNIMNKLSENMTPYDWLKISDYIEESSDKILVTHGTDTLIYSCAAVESFYRNSNKKIVFTGALNSIGHRKSDVKTAISSSIDALTNKNIGNGVYVSFRSSETHKKAELHRVERLKPIYFDEKAFSSLFNSKLGIYDKNWNLSETNIKKEEKKSFDIIPEEIDNSLVNIIKARPGFEIPEEYSKSKVLIIDSYHSGTAPSSNYNNSLINELEKTDKHIILSSRMNRIIENNYESVEKLRQKGVKVAKNIQPHVLYVRLLIGLNNGHSVSEIMNKYC